MNTIPYCAKFVFSPGEEFAEERRLWQGVASIAITPKGTIYLSWYTGGEKEPDPNNYHILYRLFDNGNAPKSAPYLAICSNPEERMQMLDARCWCDPTGRMWLFWSERRYRPEFFGVDNNLTLHTWAIHSHNPDAEEPEWSAPQWIANGNTLNAPTVLADGRWLICTFQHDSKKYTYSISADQGETWEHCTAAEKVPTAVDEAMVVEGRTPGELTLYARTLRQYGKIAYCTSLDGGKSWSHAALTQWDNAASRFWLGKLQSGRWLLVNTEHPTERTRLTARLSDDDGKSWKYCLEMDDSVCVSYPDVAQAQDGRLFICYDYNRNRDKSIYLSAITEEDIIQGKLTSPGSYLRRLFSASPLREDDAERMKQTLKDYGVIDQQWQRFCREKLGYDLNNLPQPTNDGMRAALN